MKKKDTIKIIDYIGQTNSLYGNSQTNDVLYTCLIMFNILLVVWSGPSFIGLCPQYERFKSSAEAKLKLQKTHLIV